MSPVRHQQPWSYGKNKGLYYTLIHELGHVFGLQDDHYSESVLMSAKFVDRVTSFEMIKVIDSKTIRLPSTFGCNKDFEGYKDFGYETSIAVPQDDVFPIAANGIDELRDFLGVTEQKIDVYLDSTKGKMDVKVNKVSIGSIVLKRNETVPSLDFIPIINLYLTRKQQVYPSLPNEAFHLDLGLYHLSKTMQLRDQNLVLKNGNNLNVFLTFDQSCTPTIATSFKGKVYLDIFMDRRH